MEPFPTKKGAQFELLLRSAEMGCLLDGFQVPARFSLKDKDSPSDLLINQTEDPWLTVKPPVPPAEINRKEIRRRYW